MPEQDSCYTTAGKYCACVEFHLDEHRRRGFHTSQLIEYTLGPNPDAEENKNSPLDKLTLEFSTADVMILGYRLGALADKLRENNLATLHVRPKCYAGLDRFAPCVISIKITPIEKD